MNQTKQETNQGRGEGQPIHLGVDRMQEALSGQVHGPRSVPVPGPVYPARRDVLQTGLGRLMAALDGRDEAV